MSMPSPAKAELLPSPSALVTRDLAAVPTVAWQPTSEERERLLMEHLSSVRFIARKLHQTLPRHVELDDLISAGTVGLIEACSRFDARRGSVLGLLTASTATGQLLFLPLLAWVVSSYDWRFVVWIVAGAALLLIPLVAFFLPERPIDVGLARYGAIRSPKFHTCS